MQIVTGKEQEYAEYVAKNNDPYGGAVVKFSEAWAGRMEPRIEAGEAVEKIAASTCSEADKGFGITGFMYGCAVSALSHFWVHGEALRRWHNLDTQIKDEGEKANESGGVLNPALLSISN